jgi:metacaspase-1
MPRGMSIHVGVSDLDWAAHGLPEGEPMPSAENDAQALHKLAMSRGFEADEPLLTCGATLDAVASQIASRAGKLEGGDILLVTFSGHGSRVPDRSDDELDGYDETWFLFDRQLLDDHLVGLWAQFQPGVRILVLLDCCHSGSAINQPIDRIRLWDSRTGQRDPRRFRARTLGREAERKAYAANRGEYDEIQRRYPAATASRVKASVLLLSACLDNQLAICDEEFGLFTRELLTAMDAAKPLSYRHLHQILWERLPSIQRPGYWREGDLTGDFLDQAPFAV